MKFGLLYEMETPRPWHALSEYNTYWEALAQIELADRIGLDYVWEVEHHFLEEYSHSPAPEVFYGAVSQRTKNIRIAHGVRLLPFNFNHPIKVAEQAAVLDIMSNGRMELGTGRSTTAQELDGFGVDYERTRAEVREALDIIVKAWTEEILEYDGSYIPFPDASFDLIFSSYLIEHIGNEKTIHSEMHRVLRPGGVCAHVVPTATWRLYASIVHYPSMAKKLADKVLKFKSHSVTGTASIDRTPVTLARWRGRLLYALVQRRHGEFGNWFTEHFIFQERAWRKRFEANGWEWKQLTP